MSGCKDCEECTRSFAGKLGKAALAVTTGGLSLLPAAAAAPFKRRCPQCGHPMSDHEAAKAQIAGLVAQQAQPQVIVVQVAMPAAHAQPTPARSRCEHCDSTFPEAPRCPECGAKAIPIVETAPVAAPPAPMVFTLPATAPAAPEAAVSAPAKLPWHQRPGVVILALVFFAPLGIPLVWWHKLWTQQVRVIASIASAAIFLAALASNDKKKHEVEHSSMAASPPSQRVKPAPPVEVPPYELVEDVDLAPKHGHRLSVNVRDPDLTDAQCAAIVADLRSRAGEDGQVSVRIPLHNDRPENHAGVPASEQVHFFPLCYDNLDGKGVQEGTARQMQRSLDKKPPGHAGK